MKLHKLSEFGLIKRIRKSIRYSGDVKTGIGDDCAVVKCLGKDLLVTADCVVEGNHFTTQHFSPYEIGWKAGASAISDISAMGGAPKYLLVTAGLRKTLDADFALKIFDGLKAICGKCGVEIIGGDTVRTSKEIFIDCSVIGFPAENRTLKRSGAKPGDLVYVTGNLGDAGAGLCAMQKNIRGYELLKRRQKRPAPKIREGVLLSKYGFADSCIDISDGFSGDLRHILDESKTGAVVFLNKIPLSGALKRFCAERGKYPLDFALHSGEDYELLFTVRKSKAKLLENVMKVKRIKVTCVGFTTKEKGKISVVKEDGTKRRVSPRGYDHF